MTDAKIIFYQGYIQLDLLRLLFGCYHGAFVICYSLEISADHLMQVKGCISLKFHFDL